MKFFISLFVSVCLGCFLSVRAQTPSDGAVITWEKNTYDFGDLVQGEKVEHTFRLRNTGTDPLVITNVQVTCGCTTPKGWPRDPVNPNGRAEIIVQFDSTNKIGRQNKVVTIISNATGGNNQITFSANVLEKKKVN
jgi:hypothetical protein